MAAPDLDRAATDAINALDTFRKLIVTEGFASLSLTCLQLSNIIEEWLLTYRELAELRKQAENVQVADSSQDVSAGTVASEPEPEGNRILIWHQRGARGTLRNRTGADERDPEGTDLPQE